MTEERSPGGPESPAFWSAAAMRAAWILWGALDAAPLVYVVVAVTVLSSESPAVFPRGAARMAILGAGLLLGVILALIAPRILTDERAGAPPPAIPPGAAAREAFVTFIRRHLLVWAGCDAMAALGLVSAILTGRTRDLYALVAAALVLLVATRPRRRRWESFLRARVPDLAPASDQ